MTENKSYCIIDTNGICKSQNFIWLLIISMFTHTFSAFCPSYFPNRALNTFAEHISNLFMATLCIQSTCNKLNVNWTSKAEFIHIFIA